MSKAEHMKQHFIPRDATVAELERKAADAEEKAANELEPRATELREEAKRYRESGYDPCGWGNGHRERPNERNRLLGTVFELLD